MSNNLTALLPVTTFRNLEFCVPSKIRNILRRAGAPRRTIWEPLAYANMTHGSGNSPNINSTTTPV
jgi:hypothetical protein